MVLSHGYGRQPSTFWAITNIAINLELVKCQLHVFSEVVACLPAKVVASNYL